MKKITSALITTTLVFMAVFVPVCFIGGVTGTFYTQFGITMAIAVAISLFNALTLFALVLVIGTVVDDAIVVVEAVQAELENEELSSQRHTLKERMKNFSHLKV